MRDHAPKLGPVAFDFDKRAAKLRLFRSLGECLLEQTAEPILLALNPEDVLDFLPSARARNVSGQKQTTKDLSPRKPGSFPKGIEMGDVLAAFSWISKKPAKTRRD